MGACVCTSLFGHASVARRRPESDMRWQPGGSAGGGGGGGEGLGGGGEGVGSGKGDGGGRSSGGGEGCSRDPLQAVSSYSPAPQAMQATHAYPLPVAVSHVPWRKEAPGQTL